MHVSLKLSKKSEWLACYSLNNLTQLNSAFNNTVHTYLITWEITQFFLNVLQDYISKNESVKLLTYLKSSNLKPINDKKLCISKLHFK